MDGERKGLGRGMASLIPIKKNVPELSAVEKSFNLISVLNIVPNPNQPRKFFDQTKIEELATSIREKGVLSPILVTRRADKYEIVSGERRYRASVLAGLKEVPAIIRDTEPKDSLEIAIIENVQRQDLDPIEEGAAYQELMDRFGYTQEVVAQKTGKDRATIANMVRLLKLPSTIQEALRAGAITAGHARALLGVAEVERQLYFLEKIMKEKWSVRELEARIAIKRNFEMSATARPKKGRQLSALPPAIVAILDSLRRRLGTQVRLVPSGKKGKIIIEYYSEVDLDRIYHTLIS